MISSDNVLKSLISVQLLVIGLLALEAGAIEPSILGSWRSYSSTSGCGQVSIGAERNLSEGYGERGENFYHRIDTLTPNQMSRLNNQGLRGEDFSRNKPNDTFRILVLGDSYTYGSGIREESTYSSFLQRKFGESGKKVQVVNAGWPGAGMKDYYSFYRRDGVSMDPDVVVVSFMKYDDMSWGRTWSVTQSVLEDYGLSKRTQLHKPENRKALRELGDRKGRMMNEKYVPETELHRYALKLDKLAEKENSDLLLYSIEEFPENGVLPDNLKIEHSTVLDYWDRGCGLNVLRAPEELSLNSTYTLEGDLHYNRLGNKVLADHLYEYLNNQSIVD